MRTSLAAKVAISSFAATALLAVIGCSSSEAAPEPVTQIAPGQAGFYKLNVGDVEVIALSDGTIGLDPALLNGDAQQINAALAQGHEPTPISTSVNAYVFKTGGRLILVDAGTSELFGPSLGKLPDTLRRVGYKPEQITDILVTHIHTDHTGGLMLGNARVFPNAIVHIDRKELDYWLSPANKASAPEGQKAFFDQAVAKVSPYVSSGQVATFDGAVQLFPGITSIPAPGHTPGHTLYQLESKGDKVVFWGDVLHAAAVQLPDPSVTIQFDVTPAAARSTREALFADAAAKGYMVAPAHINFPGFGHLRKEVAGSGYRWLPVPYVNDTPLVSK